MGKRAKVLLELEENRIERMWAQVEGGEFTRVVLGPKNNEDFIQLIIKTVLDSQNTIKPRKSVIENMEGFGSLDVKWREEDK
jgi:hypothetical protein